MIEVICRDPYYAYDAYHITAAFYPEAVVEGQIRQRLEEGLDATVRLMRDGEEIFVWSQVKSQRREDKICMGQSLYSPSDRKAFSASSYAPRSRAATAGR